MKKVAKGLQSISIGQYSPQLYFKGKQQHSSVYGGIFTIAFSIFFLTVSTFIFVDLFSLNNFSLQTKTFSFDNTFRCNGRINCKSINFDEYYAALFKSFDVFINIPDFNPSLEDCNQVNITATLKLRMVSALTKELYDISLTKRFNTSLEREGCSIRFPTNFIEIKNQFTDKSDEVYIDNFHDEISTFDVGQQIIIDGLNESYKVEIAYEKHKYFDSGVSSYFTIYQPTSRMMYRTFSVVEYQDFNSLSSVIYRNIPQKRSIYFDTEHFKTSEAVYVNHTQLYIRTEVLRKGVQYTRYPQSLLTALAKISGLLVLLKVSYPMMAYHRFSFFKKIEKADEKQQKVSNYQQIQINETLASLSSEGKRAEDTKIMSIEERFSFERIEDTAEKAQDLQMQFKTVSQVLYTRSLCLRASSLYIQHQTLKLQSSAYVLISLLSTLIALTNHLEKYCFSRYLNREHSTITAPTAN